MTKSPYEMRRRDAGTAIRDAPAVTCGEVAVGSISPSGDRYAILGGNLSHQYQLGGALIVRGTESQQRGQRDITSQCCADRRRRGISVLRGPYET